MTNPIVAVNITRNTAQVQRASFSGMCFIGAHRWFPERIRKYTSREGVAADMPTDSFEYIAANKAFSQSPPAPEFYIGRRESDLTITPLAVEENSEHYFTLYVNDAYNAYINYTAGAAEVAENVVDAFIAAITGDATINAHVTATKIGSGANAVLEITATTSADEFYVTNLSGLGYSYDSAETAADVVTAIKEESNVAYAWASSDHTETFVLGMAEVFEGTEQTYWVSTQQLTSILTSYSETATDVIAKVVQGNYFNTVPVWDVEADSVFPEVTFFAQNPTYTPGEVLYVNNTPAALGMTKNGDGNLLTETQKANLDARNTSYVGSVQGASAWLGGRVAGGGSGLGYWVDDIVFSHYCAARLRENLSTLLLNQKGKKLGGDYGINKVHNVLTSTLNRMVTDATKARGLDNYEILLARYNQLAPEDKASRTLPVTVEGYLTGGFQKIVVALNLSYA